MSQPGQPRSAGRTPAPLRVVSERLTDEEAAAAAAAAPAAPATAAPTGPLPTAPPRVPTPEPRPAAATAATAASPTPAAPVVARPSLPVVAPRSRRRFGDFWRLVFARRRAGRHRPETTPPQGWSMFAPQRRRPPGRRWGRR